MRRRTVLAASTLSTLGLAGCLTGSSDEATSETTQDSTTTEPATTATTAATTAEPTTEPATTEEPTTEESTEEPDSGSVEFLHPWTGGDGADGIESFAEAFVDANPGVELEVVPTARFRMRLRQRIKNEDPPDAWATWSGAGLDQFAEAFGDFGSAAPSLEGMPEAVAATGRRDGRVVAVPFALHRVNACFVERDVLADAGVDPASVRNVADLLAACERVAAETSATPFAQSLRGPWTTAQLFETVLAAELEVSGYRAYLAGDLPDDRLRSVVARLDELLSYAPEDAHSTHYVEMARRLANGEAAFMQQGTWAMAFPDVAGTETVRYRAFPGTEGVVDFQADATVLGGAPDRPDAAKSLVAFAGTTEGQRSFAAPSNRLPTRTDLDPSALADVVEPAYADYRNASTYVRSMTHGVAFGPERRTDLLSAIESFVADRDVDAAVTALQAVPADGKS